MSELTQRVLASVQETELEHHGVLGMKWGVRKDPDLMSSLRPKTADEKAFMSLRIGDRVKFPNGEELSVIGHRLRDNGEFSILARVKSTGATIQSHNTLPEKKIAGGLDPEYRKAMLGHEAKVPDVLVLETAMDLLLEPIPEDLAQEIEFDDAGDLVLTHHGVLGMKWGVRKIRGTGQKIGSAIAGTPKAARSAPSVSPDPKPKAQTQSDGARKTTSPDKETSIPTGSDDEDDTDRRRVSVKLTKKQTEKMGSNPLLPEDFSVAQLKAAAERLRLEIEIEKLIAGPDQTAHMQAVVNRIKLEQEYKRLTAKPPSFQKKVLKKSVEILASVAETQVKVFLNAAVQQKTKGFFDANALKQATLKVAEETKKNEQARKNKAGKEVAVKKS